MWKIAIKASIKKLKLRQSVDKFVLNQLQENSIQQLNINKKRGRHDSIRYPQGFKVDENNNRIFLPKLGWVRYRNTQKIQGTLKNITVSLSGDRWYASIQTERVVDQPVHPSSSIVGIDMGITQLATLSNGDVFEPVNSLKQHQNKLARYQRDMGHKIKFSNNWKKVKKKIQRLHCRVANIRRDHLHKSTTIISKNHAMVCIEDLQI